MNELKSAMSFIPDTQKSARPDGQVRQQLNVLDANLDALEKYVQGLEERLATVLVEKEVYPSNDSPDKMPVMVDLAAEIMAKSARLAYLTAAIDSILGRIEL